MRVGRPPYPYTDKIAEEICDRLVEGESMIEIAKDESLPSLRTMLKWLKENEDFRMKCARARDIRAEFIHEQLVHIENRVDDGSLSVDKARVMIAGKQWRAAKLAPKKWGDKQVVENVGPGGGPMVSTTMTADEFEARARKIADEF